MIKPGLGYFQQKLTFTEDAILDEFGKNVMMLWEKGVMEEAAEIICYNQGDVLNIGFGMGIIDTAIQNYNPRTHWIIEGHPDIQKKIIEGGWLKKPHVRVIFARWQDVIDYLPKFNGIYFDTWDEKQYDFNVKVSKILKPDGVFCFFNKTFGYKFFEENEEFNRRPYESLSKFNIEIKTTEIKEDIPQNHYWPSQLKVYKHPICTFKQEYK
jgi:protein arginine N-methyltransferase 2